MAIVKILFHEILQDTQTIGGDDEHMKSRIFFSVEVNGKRYDGLHTDVKQTVGTSSESAPLEVSPPRGGYRGPFDHEKFQRAATEYFRATIGSGGSVFGITGGSGIRMKNNRIGYPQVAEFEASGQDVAW